MERTLNVQQSSGKFKGSSKDLSGICRDLPGIFQEYFKKIKTPLRIFLAPLQGKAGIPFQGSSKDLSGISRDLPGICWDLPGIFQDYFRKIKTPLWISLAPLQGKAGIPFGHLGQFQGSSRVLPGIFQGSSRDLPGIFQVSSRDPLRIQGSSRDLPRSSRNTSERFRLHFEFAWHHCKERPASHSVI